MTDKPLHDVVIVGGSLTGLLHGIVQKYLGRNVTILEASPTDERSSQAAGIGCRENILRIFNDYNMSTEGLGNFVTLVDGFVPETPQSPLVPVMKIPYNGVMTAWNVMYHRLRAYFDGWVPEGYPMPTLDLFGPGEQRTGQVEYRKGIKVTGLHYDKPSDQVLITYTDLITSIPNQTLRTSLVIAADGSNSLIRDQLLPHMPERKYVGYFLWRGTYPLRDTTQASTELTNLGTCFYMQPRLKTYSVIYQIPPDNGSPDPSDRLVNFAWYDWCPKDSPLYKLAMTGTTGYQHRFNVPRGQLNPAAWSHQVDHAKQIMHAAASDMVAACAADPFVTAVSESISPQVTFFDNRVVLSGEALAIARPHSGAALNESARQAIMLGEVARGRGHGGVTRMRRGVGHGSIC